MAIAKVVDRPHERQTSETRPSSDARHSAIGHVRPAPRTRLSHSYQLRPQKIHQPQNTAQKLMPRLPAGLSKNVLYTIG